jgi:hypothetical protein
MLDRFQELPRRPMWRIKSANWEKFKTRPQIEFENNEIHDAESFTTMMIDCAKESSRKGEYPGIQDLIRERRRAERRHHSNPNTKGTVIALRQKHEPSKILHEKSA